MLRVTHPDWYFEHYGTVFGRGSAYAEEARRICHGDSLVGKCVQEIGAGAGGHAAAMLAGGAAMLKLVDIDERAIAILRERFANEGRVEIVLGNGFSRAFEPAFDLVYCMYSVVSQQCESLDALVCRVGDVLCRVRQGGKFVFETIDYDVSKSVYPEGTKTCIYEGANGRVFIESRYHGELVEVIYSGVLGSEQVNYTVHILRTNRRTLKDALSERGWSIWIEDLDARGRRLLCTVANR